MNHPVVANLSARSAGCVHVLDFKRYPKCKYRSFCLTGPLFASTLIKKPYAINLVVPPIPCCVPCPNCGKFVARGKLNTHLKDCKKYLDNDKTKNA